MTELINLVPLRTQSSVLIFISEQDYWLDCSLLFWTLLFLHQVASVSSLPLLFSTPNLWNTVKAVLRGKFIATQAYLKKQEKSQINNLTLHLKQLEKEEIDNPRVSRRKEILNIRAEINAKGKRP